MNTKVDDVARRGLDCAATLHSDRSTPFSTSSATRPWLRTASAARVRSFATRRIAARRLPGISMFRTLALARPNQTSACSKTPRRCAERRRIFHAAVHRPDDDRRAQAEQQGRLARRHRNRLMDHVDAMFPDQSARHAALRDLRRHARQEAGREVGDLFGQVLADPEHGDMKPGVFDVDDPIFSGKQLHELVARARVCQQPDRQSARAQLAEIVDRQHRFAAEPRGRVIGDDQDLQVRHR